MAALGELLCNKDLVHMHFDMLFERSLVGVSLVALVAHEWLFPSVLPYVSLQIARRSTNIVALATFEWLFSCVLSHYVNF